VFFANFVMSLLGIGGVGSRLPNLASFCWSPKKTLAQLLSYDFGGAGGDACQKVGLFYILVYAWIVIKFFLLPMHIHTSLIDS
jgi:hypothetical protein